MQERAAQIILILGFNGTGKTTILKKFLVSQLKNNQRALIITPDDREWLKVPLVHSNFPERIKSYKGARRMIYYDPSNKERNQGIKSTLQNLDEFFTNGLLIFDDCRSYLHSATSREIHNFMIRRRQKEADMIFVAHGFTDVPPKIFTFLDKIILFKTKDNIYMRKNVLKDFQKMVDAQERINKIAETKPHYFEIINQ